jgi:hypothetical protein
MVEWRRIDSILDPAVRLQAVREGPYAGWVSGLDRDAPISAAERRLREAWMQSVDECARWLPDRWRPAFGWLRWLPYLPALQKIARGGRPMAWMREDAVLGPIVAHDPRERLAALQETPLGPLREGFGEEPDLVGAWAGHWRSLWPADGHAGLEALGREISRHRERLAALPAATGSTEELERLATSLHRAFRREPLSATAVAAYLGLVALDALRLRGALVTGMLPRTGGAA